MRIRVALRRGLLPGVALWAASGAGAALAAERPSGALDCIIEPMSVVKLASPTVGLVSSVEVDRGDRIRKGQPLARLESSLEEVNVDLARERTTNDATIRSQRARLEFLRNKHSRAEKLRSNAYVSEAAYEEATADMRVSDQQVREAEHNLKVAQIELRRAQAALHLRTIASPVDGVVVERLLSPGEYRNEQAALMVLAQTDPLRVEVLVPTAEYGRITVGTTATVYPEDPVGGRYTARVTVVDQVIDSASGTFGIRLALPNPDNALPAGLRCGIAFHTATRAASAAPGVGAARTGDVAR